MKGPRCVKVLCLKRVCRNTEMNGEAWPGGLARECWSALNGNSVQDRVFGSGIPGGKG